MYRKLSGILAIGTALVAPLSPAAADPLSIGRCLEVYAGLAALDHYDRFVGDKAVPVQYKLGTLRYAIAQNMANLTHIRDAADRARMGLLAEVANGKPIEPNSPELARLNAEYQKILDQPCDVTPGRLRLADLKLGDGPDENAIPPSVLSALAPIIDEK